MKHEIKFYQSELKQLRPILETWFQVVQEYSERVSPDEGDPSKKDSLWWYRERTQVGFLAIAAWLNGWAVLEEWGVDKGAQRQKSKGRNDLWIGRSRTSGLCECYIEAKHTWCDVHKGKEHCIKRLRNALEAAKSSAQQLNCKPPSQKLAAVFASPVWKMNRKLMFKDAQADWIKICRHELEVGVLASVRAERDECPVGDDGTRFLGSVLLLTRVT